MWEGFKQPIVLSSLVFCALAFINLAVLFTGSSCGQFSGFSEEWRSVISFFTAPIAERLPAFRGFERYWGANGGHCSLEIFRVSSGFDVIVLVTAFICWPLTYEREVNAFSKTLVQFADSADGRKSRRRLVLGMVFLIGMALFQFLGDYRSVFAEGDLVRDFYDSDAWVIIHALLIFLLLVCSKLLFFLLRELWTAHKH